MAIIASLQQYVKDDFVPQPKAIPEQPHEDLTLDLEDLACPFCGMPLVYHYLSHERHLVTLIYDISLRVVHRTCENEDCLAHAVGRDFYNEALDLYALPKKGFALDVTLLIAHLTQQGPEIYTEAGVATYLWEEHGIRISQPAVHAYKHLALALGEAILAGNAGDIKAGLDLLPARIYSVDGLSSNRSQTLFVVRDVFSGAVLGVALLDQHDAETMHAFLAKVFETFGQPDYLVGDGERGLLGAAREFYPEIPYQYCHRHFLDNLGAAMMEDLFKGLKKISTSSRCSSRFAMPGTS